MANLTKKIKEIYIKWLHEKRRAHGLGKVNYGDNCDLEIKRLEEAFPKLIGLACECKDCSSGIDIKSVKDKVWRPKKEAVSEENR
jgi:hypothetical protein